MSSYREINDKGKSKQDHRRRGHNYIKRITRIDPVTGEIEQRCSRCGEWWFQDKEFWWYFNGEPAPTCKACHAEARERNKAPQRLPALKPIQAKKAKRHTTPKKRPDGYWQRKRAGITCSSLSFEALGQLIEAEGQGWPFIPLPDVHPHTINALQNQNWIISSDGLDGIRYCITSEGKRVYRLFSKPPKRTDGICPTCGVRPKHRYPSGLLYGYCLECENKSKRRNYALGRQRINSESVIITRVTEVQHDPEDVARVIEQANRVIARQERKARRGRVAELYPMPKKSIKAAQPRPAETPEQKIARIRSRIKHFTG